jgi:hypothetical protein
MQNEISFQAFIEQELPAGSFVSKEDIDRVLGSLGVTSSKALTYASSALREWSDESTLLESRPSGWRVQVSGKLVQSAAMSAVLWGMLIELGFAESIPVALATALVASLFDIERVKLSQKEEAVMVKLVLYDRARTLSPSEWYAELPTDLQAQLNELEFLDVMEKIVQSGHGRKADDGVTLYPSGKGRLAISIE